MPRTGRRLPRPIATADLFAALAAASPWLVLAGWCGLRACEIAGLRREAVLETASPPVLVIAEDATKGHAERAVPLCEFAAAELSAVPLPRAGFVFRRHDGRPGPNQPWRVSQLANMHLHACGSAASLHQLRHWFATEAYRARRDLRVVQELMGHANPSSTAGYAAFARADQVSAVESLPVPGKLRAVADR